MTVEQLRKYHGARPFRSFILHIADGSAVRVTHPESLARSPSGRTLVAAFPDESSRVIDLFMVTRIEIPGEARRRGNGKPRPWPSSHFTTPGAVLLFRYVWTSICPDPSMRTVAAPQSPVR